MARVLLIFNVHPCACWYYPLYLVILHLKTSNKKYNLNNGSKYLFPKFQNILSIFTQLTLGSFLNLVIFATIHFKYLLLYMLEKLELNVHGHITLCNEHVLCFLEVRLIWWSSDWVHNCSLEKKPQQIFIEYVNAIHNQC